MSSPPFVVHLIDDDSRILTAVSRLLRGGGYDVRCFSDAETFLDMHDPDLAGCAVVDLGLPGKDGFDIQRALEDCGRPIVFLTGRGTISASVKAVKAGALDFLEKPVDAEVLLAAIAQARQIDCSRRQIHTERMDFRQRVSRLTPREREVLGHVVAGRLNKQIAGDLGTVEKTVKVHRSRMMGKMGVRTVADLVRMVQTFGP